ncbi:MAG TPA: DNA translocase FtsK 4TM domain-containing protein [Pyrinomonadaceae bacterium]|jgi:S-DNA-T family DNA segregation ATPase FtsK/SpoIIIE
MATTQTDARIKATAGEPRNTRRNEIVAIALFAIGALLVLCLASYNPSDPSWNAAGQAEVHNLIGAIGANVAVTLYQTLGLAAILLPLLLLAAAWRRFRTRRIYAPFSRIVGLLTLLLAAASLCALFLTRPIVDGSFMAGGFVGVFIADGLRGVLNTVGASILLFALAAMGLLLATNFSFTRAYERAVEAFGHPSDFFRALTDRFNAWRTRRRELAQQRAAARQAARAEREALQNLSATDQAATTATASARDSIQIKKETTANASTAIRRAGAAATQEESLSPQEELRRKLAQAEAELAAIVAEPSNESHAARKNGATAAASATADGFSSALSSSTNSASPTSFTEPTAAATKRNASTATTRKVAHTVDDFDDADDSEAAEIEEMVRTASVVRTEDEDAASATSQRSGTAAVSDRAARRTEKTATPAILDDYHIPSLEFLNAPPPRHEEAEDVLRGLATQVAEKCREFNVTGKIEYICPGPVVTTYEFKPDPGVKYSRVTGLVDDLCLALKAESVRIDRVPGKAHVGIEVPNPHRETIHLREVIESNKYRESDSKLTIALGKTIDGLNYVADLAKMPHLLIAGATGTGKSVAVNSLIVSILYKASPAEVKFIMVDPKRLELGLYADIPHLATPIITDPKRAAHALKWGVSEMERRYKELAGWGVRNIDGFNAEVARRNLVADFDAEGNPHKPLPYIVIIIDELADLMMVSGHEVEEAITRLAQMARAVGIHLVLATQRPSVDVITGLIKANFPSRIAFRVSSKVDSRTIIDSNGAEQLLGRGDMLFLPPGTSRLVRVHGAFVDETEIARIVKHIKAQAAPTYDETITLSEEEASGEAGTGGDRDELFEQALRICVEMKRASTSVLQRRLRIGYGRAAAILDAMERDGFIGQADGARPRPVLGRAFETIDHWDNLQANDTDAT